MSPAPPARALILTCEHAGAQVPARYRACFIGARAQADLASHRGCDLGAGWLAERLAQRLGAPLFRARVTRLVVDLNRSLHHRRLLSEYTAGLPADERAHILAHYYHPYRERVGAAVAAGAGAATEVTEAGSAPGLVHLSIHSFTPALEGAVRAVDVGLLYDPARASERELCRRWQAALQTAAPGLRVRRNQPYRGVADGFTTALRKRFSADRYAGVELEVNQALVAAPSPRRRALAETLSASLLSALSVPAPG